MKGRRSFTAADAAEIRRLLVLVRQAEPGSPQKVLRAKLRAIGFYISNFHTGRDGFTRSDFDDLVRSGAIRIEANTATSIRRLASEIGQTPAPRSQRPRREPAAPADGSTVADALSALSANAMTIRAAMSGGVPDVPGLYALYGSQATWKTLGLGAPPDSRPLYVGKAEDSLRTRDLNTHFATGETGRSSPRRSFAALLARAGRLDVEAIPRRPHNPEPGKWHSYALAPAGDERLTAWMLKNLRITVWPKTGPAPLTSTERAVMRAWQPPLNLTGVKTPWLRQVKDARSAMADGARAWAKVHGRNPLGQG